VLRVGKRIFCKKENTAIELLDFAIQNGYEVVNVKQGYAACSTLVVNDKKVITTDRGMKKTFEKYGIDTLLVTFEDIELKGYNSGFIGGSVCILGNFLYVFGELEKHTDFSKIQRFIADEHLIIKSILPGGVSDFGGIRALSD
jgi:hypothetical protein